MTGQLLVRQLSPTGDYLFGNSANDFLDSTPEAVGQIVKTTLLLWLGEWFLDNTLGTPYMQGILGKHGEASANSTIQGVVLGITFQNTQLVTDIQNLVSSVNDSTRAYSVEFDIDTIFGPTSVQLQNYVNY